MSVAHPNTRPPRSIAQASSLPSFICRTISFAASVGSADGTTYQMDPQIREMRKYPGSFDSTNLRYTLDPGGGNDLPSTYKQFYNSVQLFF